MDESQCKSSSEAPKECDSVQERAFTQNDGAINAGLLAAEIIANSTASTNLYSIWTSILL